MARPKKKKETDKEIKGDLLHDILDEIGNDETVQLLGGGGLAKKVRGVISTQAPGIDAAIGRGGIPLSRLTILSGKESSGKTTLALHIAAECQKMGGVVVYMDKEYKLDPDYARRIGVDIDKLIISQPPYLEKIFEIGESIIKRVVSRRKKTGERVPILIVLDSMNAAISKRQFDGGWEDEHYGPQAKVFSEKLPKFIPLIDKEDVALLFISQIRKKIGVTYGDDENLAGGWAPKFYSSLILKITSAGVEKVDNQKTANKIRIECVKNQISSPFQKTECTIRYGKGIDFEDSLLFHAIKMKIIKKSGTWLSYKGNRLGQGIKNSAEFLRKSDILKNKIYKKLKKKVGWGL